MSALSLVVPVLFTARPLAWLITRRFIGPALLGYWIGIGLTALGEEYVIAFVAFANALVIVLTMDIVRRRK